MSVYRYAGVVVGLGIVGISVYKRFFCTSPSTHLLNDLDSIISTIVDVEVIAQCRNYRSFLVNFSRRIESIISDLEALNSFKFKSGDNHFSEHEEPFKTMQLHLNLNFIKTYADSLEDAENNLNG